MMTTVSELIKELQKMPQEVYVSLNIYRKNEDRGSVYMTKIEVKEENITSPFADPGSKQKIVSLNQKGI